MILTSNFFFRALRVHPDPDPDPEIRIVGFRFPDLGIRFSGYSDPDQSVGLPKKFYLPKPYMGPILCYWHILIQPPLLGVPLIDLVLSSKVIPDFRIGMNR